MKRSHVVASCAASLLALALGACAGGGPPADDPMPPRPTEHTSAPRFQAPSSAALVCPGARNASAWLADGTFWNGDVEMAFFDGDGKPLEFGHKAPIGDGIPVYFSFAPAGGGSIQAVAFSPWRDARADTAGWAWVGIEAKGPREGGELRFQLAFRSGGGDGRYIDPRAAHADSFVYASDGIRVLREGRTIALIDSHASEPPAGGEAAGVRVRYDVYEQRRTYVVPAGATITLRFGVAPLGGVMGDAAPPSWSEPFAKALDRTVANWRAELAKGARYTFPDARWQQVFEASRGLLVTDYERHGTQRSPLGNPLQYRDFYLRDGARVVRALDLLGRADLATEGIDLLYQFQWPPGAFLSQRGQLDGTGQALWALAQHVALTNDEATLRRHGDAAIKGATWVLAMRQATTTIGGAAAGLMPYSDPRDNENIRGHLLGTDAWSVCALEATAYVAQRMGRDRTTWDAATAAYRTALVAIWDREARRQGRPLPPSVEMGARDWGNLSASYPCGVFAAGDPRVRSLDAWLHSTQYSEGLMTFGSRDSIHHYVTFDVTQARLRRGDRAGTLEDVAAYLDHTLPDGTGFEFRHRTGKGYGDNLPPHGTFAAMWIDLARACVLYESGDSLIVLSGVPAEWFSGGPAGALEIERAPTTFGPAALSLRREATGESSLALDLPAPARVELPVGFRAEPVAGAAGTFSGTTLFVPKGKGTWRVTRAAAR